MKQNQMLKELLLILITLIPIVYLASIYSSLPEEVPIHWNFKGEVDDYAHKSMLGVLVLVINVPVYLLMLFLPKVSAKRENIELMGKKYFRLRLIMQLFMSGIVCSIIFGSSGVSDVKIEFLLGLCLTGFMVLFGNYMVSIRQNHFMGIRTPWTLENEAVWKKTHQLGGRLWIGGGLIGLVLILIVPANWALITIVGLMVIPMLFAAIYSFFLFKKLA